MKALSRYKDPGWFGKRAESFFVTTFVYFVACGTAFIGYVIYQMLPPMDWDEILKIGAGAFFFCLNWYLIDSTIWD